MAWTTPATWTTGEVVTAAKMNTHVRDNFLETAPAKALTAGDLFYATGANAITKLGLAGEALLAGGSGAPAWRQNTDFIGDSSYAGFGETSNTDFNAFSVGAGTAVAVTGVVTGTAALVWYGATFVANSTAGGLTILNFRISGATTVAANVNRDLQSESGNANDRGNPGGMKKITSLTPGTHAFTLQARVSTGLGTISFPYIAVQPL